MCLSIYIYLFTDVSPHIVEYLIEWMYLSQYLPYLSVLLGLGCHYSLQGEGERPGILMRGSPKDKH